MARGVARGYVAAMKTQLHKQLHTHQGVRAAGALRSGLRALGIAGIFTLCFSGAAFAGDYSSGSASGKQSANKDFLEKACKETSEETHVSRVVAQRSSNPNVRDFAQEVASSHASIDSDLEKLASNNGIALKNHDSDNTRIMEKWSKKDIDDLNEDYVDAMVDSHEDTVELFQKAATNTDLDPAISEYARKSLPALQKHLARAKQLDKSLN